jgi:hypothetical protein
MVLELSRSGLLQAYIHCAWGLWEGEKILLSPKIIFSSRGRHAFYYFKQPSNQAERLMCDKSLQIFRAFAPGFGLFCFEFCFEY